MEDQLNYHVVPVNRHQIQQIEKRLTSLLNYGGFYVDGMCNPGHITLVYEQGDLTDEIDNMRRLSATLAELANALDGGVKQDEVLADPAISDWFKAALHSLEGRDPADSLSDVDLLQRLQQQRFSEAVGNY